LSLILRVSPLLEDLKAGEIALVKSCSLDFRYQFWTAGGSCPRHLFPRELSSEESKFSIIPA
jgi:hypothetical protein